MTATLRSPNRAKLVAASWLIWPLSSSATVASGQYDPTAYLEKEVETAPAAATLTEGDVTLDGVRYRRFAVGAAAILVPDFTRVDKASLERAQCEGPGIPTSQEICQPGDAECWKRQAEREKDTNHVATRAEFKISDKWKAYASLILTTIRNKCGSTAYLPKQPNTVEASPNLIRPELGIEYRDEHKRDPTTYRIFNQGTQKALGFGASF